MKLNCAFQTLCRFPWQKFLSPYLYPFITHTDPYEWGNDVRLERKILVSLVFIRAIERISLHKKNTVPLTFKFWEFYPIFIFKICWQASFLVWRSQSKGQLQCGTQHLNHQIFDQDLTGEVGLSPYFTAEWLSINSIPKLPSLVILFNNISCLLWTEVSCCADKFQIVQINLSDRDSINLRDHKEHTPGKILEQERPWQQNWCSWFLVFKVHSVTSTRTAHHQNDYEDVVNY